MTSITLPLRSESQRVRPARRARLLRLELRHSTMIWLLPLLGALFYFDTFRSAMGYPPIWFLRSSVSHVRLPSIAAACPDCSE